MPEKILTHLQHRKIDHDYKQTARVANLHYISDCSEGITRHRKGPGFYYKHNGKILKDAEQLARIKKLAIPPAWTEVWICASHGGHIQATGFDANKRKQYRYHADWNSLRNETKFHRLLEFGQALPKLRRSLKKNLSLPELTADKVMATIVELMQHTYIRVGNNGYEKLYGSYGLTTMKDRHVHIEEGKINFSFIGKKGIDHSITINNKKLAKVVKQCRDVPGKELFQYYDKKGNRHSIDSGMVNHYIKNATGEDFSAKDFRTWAGSLRALENFRKLGQAETPAMAKKNILATFDVVSEKLGNTRNVCKKYYVHPGLIRLYEENKLDSTLQKFKTAGIPAGLHTEEKALMFLLKKYL